MASIKEAGKGKIVGDCGMQTYIIGFTNLAGNEDETELEARNGTELEKLWKSLCPEFECKPNSVLFVERVSNY